jgi:hypothetical protein
MGLLHSITSGFSNIVGDVFGSQNIQDAASSGRNQMTQYYGDAKAALKPWQDFGQTQMANMTKFTESDPYASLNGMQAPTNPYGDTAKSLMDLQANPSSITNTPFYQFQLSQGLAGLDRSAISKGKLFSGGNAQDIINYAEGLASTSYGDEFSRRYNLANLQNQNFQQTLNQYNTGYTNKLNTINAQFGQNFNLAQLGQNASTAAANAAVGTGSNLLQSWQTQGQDEATAGATGMSAIADMGAFAILKSDRRLKSNITRIGTHPLGIGIYEYDIFNRHEIGVMAQEVLQVKPEAVILDSDGYYMVNYAQL